MGSYGTATSRARRPVRRVRRPNPLNPVETGTIRLGGRTYRWGVQKFRDGWLTVPQQGPVEHRFHPGSMRTPFHYYPTRAAAVKAAKANVRRFVGVPNPAGPQPLFTSDRDFDATDVPRVDAAWFGGRKAQWKTVTLAGVRGAVARADGLRIVKYSVRTPTGGTRTLYAYNTGTTRKAAKGAKSATNPRPRMTMAIARAAAQDAGDRSMRKAGRKAWSRADYNVAVREFNRVYPEKDYIEDVRAGRTGGKRRNPVGGPDLFGPPYYLVHFDGRIEKRAYQTRAAAEAAALRLTGDVMIVQGTLAEVKEKYSGKKNPRRSRRKAAPRRRVRRANPEAPAAKLYERFHGQEPSEVVEVRERVAGHGWLTALGDLVSMKLRTPSGVNATIEFDDRQPVLLASNERGDQLYFVGGDQKIPLRPLKLSGKRWERDSMLLGDLRQITYRTRKSMHKFDLIDYWHKVGEETGVRPVVTYDRLNHTLAVSGGQYDVRPEGITN